MRTTGILKYGSHDRNRLSMFLPDKEEFPVFVYFHGGGIQEGDVGPNPGFFAKYLESRGIGLVTATYRLYPDTKYPEFIEDAALAVEEPGDQRDEALDREGCGGIERKAGEQIGQRAADGCGGDRHRPDDHRGQQDHAVAQMDIAGARRDRQVRKHRQHADQRGHQPGEGQLFHGEISHEGRLLSAKYERCTRIGYSAHII